MEPIEAQNVAETVERLTSTLTSTNERVASLEDAINSLIANIADLQVALSSSYAARR